MGILACPFEVWNLLTFNLLIIRRLSLYVSLHFELDTSVMTERISGDLKKFLESILCKYHEWQ